MAALGLRGALLGALCLALATRQAAAKRSTRDWDKMDFKDLEKEWEDGDEEAELADEWEVRKVQAEKRMEAERRKAAKAQAALKERMKPQENGMPFDPNSFSMDEIRSMAGPSGMAGLGGMSGGGDPMAQDMMFIDMDTRGGAFYGKPQMDEFTRRWKDLMLTGGISAQLYNLGDNQGLISVEKHMAGRAKDFLLERDEVAKVRWNNQDYYKEGVNKDEL